VHSQPSAIGETDIGLLPIHRIHHAAETATWQKLDERVHVSNELSLYDIRDRSSEPAHCYLDVPIESVVALGHRNDFGNGSWRDAVAALHGTGWEEDIFRYFDSPLLERSFPAANSRYQLRMTCVGGASECDNGNHRLAAAMAWLGHRDGAAACLRMVHITAYRLDPTVRYAIQSLAERGRSLFLGLRRHDRADISGIGSDIKIAFSRENDRESIHAIRGAELASIQQRRYLLERLSSPRREDDLTYQFIWHELPPPVLRALLNDGWVNRQWASAWRRSA
jgi:hypothetical protein